MVTRSDRQWSNFSHFIDQAERLWDLGNEREQAAEQRSEVLLSRATGEIDRDYRGRNLDPKDRQFYIDKRHDDLKAQDRVYNNHIGMNQFHHRKGTYAALMALLHKENSDG